MNAADNVPSQSWYIAAAAAVVSGVLVAGALVAWMFLTRDDGTQFAAPGTTTMDLRAGPHLIWNDYRTEFDGQRYDSDEQVPPEAVIWVRDPSGAVVATRRAPDHRFSTRKTERRALLAFTAAQPGTHEIAVEGAFKRRVFSVAPDRVMRAIGAPFGAFAALFLGTAAGFALWAWAFFKRDAAADKLSPVPAARPQAASAEEQSLRKLTALVYGLQLAGYFTGVSPVAGVIINYVKRDAVAGTWLESHFRWQIRTFWIALAWGVLGALLLLAFVGLFVLGVAAMWFLYRGIKGWLALAEGKPMLGP